MQSSKNPTSPKGRWAKKILDWALPILVILMLAIPSVRVFIAGNLQRVIMLTGVFNTSVKKELSIPLEEDIVFTTAEGETQKLSSIQTKYIFINYWATWCPPCVAELPSISGLKGKLPENQVTFLLFSQDEDYQKSVDFLRKRAPNLNSFRQISRMPDPFMHNSIPRTYIIDNERNTIVYEHVGIGDYNTRAMVKFLSQ